MTTFGDYFPRLNRPEYVASPEALLTSLAWGDQEALQADGSSVALTYDREGGGGSSRNLVARRTRTPFVAALETLGATGTDIERRERPYFADAVANSLVGVVSAKSQVRAAIPITPAVGRLQNIHGLMGKANPPSFDVILEQIYALGGGSHPSCTSSWSTASALRIQSDPLIGLFDEAAAAAVEVQPRSAKGDVPGVRPGEGPLTAGPCVWMAQNWDELCREEWVQSLPTRVWTDWATTILRMGVAFSFLWEAQWFLALGRALLETGQGGSSPQVPRDLIRWAVSTSDDGQRNVAPELKSVIERGNASRAWLSELRGEVGDQPLGEVRRMLHEPSRSAHREELREAIQVRRRGSANNVWEAVKYSLVYREVNGPNADHYGLLRSVNNRSLYLDPGTEFLAMVASLAVSRPGGEGNVGQVMDSLAGLGIRPRLSELVDRLELAGLAHGSADADQGVSVSSAFGRH